MIESFDTAVAGSTVFCSFRNMFQTVNTPEFVRMILILSLLNLCLGLTFMFETKHVRRIRRIGRSREKGRVKCEAGQNKIEEATGANRVEIREKPYLKGEKTGDKKDIQAPSCHLKGMERLLPTIESNQIPQAHEQAIQ